MAKGRQTRQPPSKPPRRPPGAKRSPPPPDIAQPASAQERYTPAQILNALSQSRGMVTAAARLLHCGRQCIYDYKAKYPEIDQALLDEREMQLDRTELKLFAAIDKGEGWAITLYLKTIGRSRGYIEKQDIGLDALTLEQLVLLAQQKRAAKKAAHA